MKKIQKEKAQESVSYKENLNFKIIKTLQKQLKLKIKKKHFAKSKINVDSLKKDQKEFLKNNKLYKNTT